MLMPLSSGFLTVSLLGVTLILRLEEQALYGLGGLPKPRSQIPNSSHLSKSFRFALKPQRDSLHHLAPSSLSCLPFVFPGSLQSKEVTADLWGVSWVPGTAPSICLPLHVQQP